MNILGVIPARKGSKGLKGKNLIDLAGRPLIDYTFQLVSSLDILDCVYLTTDDKEIIKLSTKYDRVKVPFVRDSSIATDKTPMNEVVNHLVSYCEKKNEHYDYIVLFQPTTPFRDEKEIEKMIHFSIYNNLDSSFAVTNVWHHPSEYITITNNRSNFILSPKDCSRRQDFEKVYFITGALYIVKLSFFKRTKTFVNEESYPYKLSEETMIDIDNVFHYNIAQAFAKGIRINEE